MAEATDTAAGRIRALHEARARAELWAADALAPGSDVVRWRGALIARIACVKGLPGPAEAAGDVAFAGADGSALALALEALGYDPADAFFTLSRPERGLAPERVAKRLRLQIEAVGARTVVALDADAAADLAAAFGTGPLEAGVMRRALGRRLVAVEAFEASLAEEARKRTAWEQLKAAAPEGPAFG